MVGGCGLGYAVNILLLGGLKVSYVADLGFIVIGPQVISSF